MKTTANAQLLRVSAVAEMLLISRSETYKLISQGFIRSVRIGTSVRVPAEEVRELVGKGTGGTKNDPR